MAELKKINIGIIGAYHHPNFGDQLLFNILSEWIWDRYPEAKINVPWGDSEEIEWPNGVVVGGGLKVLLSCDAIIFGGGGYFGEPGEKAQRKKNAYTTLDKVGCFFRLPEGFGGKYFGEYGYLRAETFRFVKLGLIASVLKLARIPYAIIGAGLGPITTGLGKIGVRQSLKYAQRITLRDVESVNYANELFQSDTILVSNDMVLSVMRQVTDWELKARARVAVHLGPATDRSISIVELERLVSSIQKMGAEVSLISDCRPQSGCEVLQDKLIKNLGSNVNYIPYQGVDNFIRLISEFDLIVTSKLHCGILAYREGVVPISIAEHIKTRRFYKQAGLEANSFDLSTSGFRNALERIGAVLQNPSQEFQMLREKREEIHQSANFNRIVLKKFLCECLGE